MSPIQIDRVTHRLKSVKRDPDRQHDVAEELRQLYRAHPQHFRKPADIPRKKGRVFEKREHAQIYENRDQHPRFSFFMRRPFGRDHFSAGVIDERRAQHQQGEPRIPPAVKNVTHQRERKMLHHPRRRVVEQQRDGQKIEKEDVG